MNKSVFKSLFILFKRYPISFLKQINLDNYKTLRRALLNEPLSEILSNATKLLQRSKNENSRGLEKKINVFINQLPDLNNFDSASIYVSHEASLTGAPLIVLNIAKHYKESHNTLPIHILCVDGEIKNKFEEIGPTYVLKYYHNKRILKQEIKYLISGIHAAYDLKNIFVNSEGSTRILQYLKNTKDINIITLIHEMGSYYPKNSWNHISKLSDHIIFPSNIVKLQAQKNSTFDKNKLHVLGQGLMKEELFTANRKKSKSDITRELNIPEESIIILGCGQLILRKGIDVFISVAISTLNSLKNTNNIYFIWLGDSRSNEQKIWANRDIEYSGHKENILLIGQKNNTIPYFTGSDIFLLTSRGDPYPCVVHEAYAAGLPVIGFKNAGGIQEMINTDIGFLIDYADITEMSKAILIYINDLEYLKEHQSNAVTYAKESLDFSEYVLNIEKIIDS